MLVGTPLVLGVGAVYLWNRSWPEGRGFGERELGSGEEELRGEEDSRGQREP